MSVVKNVARTQLTYHTQASWGNSWSEGLPVKGIVFVDKTNVVRGRGTRNGAKSFFRPLNVPPLNSREFPGVRQRKPEREIDISRQRRRTDTASARIWSRVRATRRKREGELLTFHDTAHARVTDSIEHDALSSRVAAVLRAPRHSALDSCIA